METMLRDLLDPHVVQMPALSFHTLADLSQGIKSRHMGELHHDELATAGDSFGRFIALVLRDNSVKCIPVYML